MTRLVIPGGWYAAALPGFTYAALVPHLRQVQTSQGSIPYPVMDPDTGATDEPLFLDLTLVGGFRIAGKGHSSNSSWEWIDGQWWRLGPACGNFSVIYDRLGLLHLSDCSMGVNGWRYEDDLGRLVSGDETYAGHGLNEYTQLAPDLWVGQGTGGGVVVNDAGTLRRLVPGECYAVKARRAGESVAIAFYSVAPDRSMAAVIVFTTIAELRALPVWVAPTSPAPAPAPIPVPLEDPMNKPEITVDRFTLTPAARLPDGEVAVFYDRQNPHGARVRLWVEGGSCRMSIEYPGVGKGETLAKRMVR